MASLCAPTGKWRSDWLAALGLTPESDSTVLVDGSNLEICFQRIDVESTGKRPLHVNLSSKERVDSQQSFRDVAWWRRGSYISWVTRMFISVNPRSRTGTSAA